MHTYKIYFRFYLLLLPLCLANVKIMSYLRDSIRFESVHREVSRLTLAELNPLNFFNCEETTDH